MNTANPGLSPFQPVNRKTSDRQRICRAHAWALDFPIAKSRSFQGFSLNPKKQGGKRREREKLAAIKPRRAVAREDGRNCRLRAVLRTTNCCYFFASHERMENLPGWIPVTGTSSFPNSEACPLRPWAHHLTSLRIAVWSLEMKINGSNVPEKLNVLVIMGNSDEDEGEINILDRWK